MVAKRHPSNRQLAWERLQRGWSYDELARRVRTAMRDIGEGDTGLTANTVRRWETGERWPDPRYRKHLVTIFSRPASELGLLLPEELATRPTSDLTTEIRRLQELMADELRDRGIDRSTFLKGLLGIGAIPMIDDLFAAGSAEPISRAIDDRTAGAEGATAYADIVGSQRSLYWTSPAPDLFESVYANVQLGVRLLRGASLDDVRQVLATALAECALLAGRLSFFDLHQPAIAERCYDTGLRASRDAGDHGLAAAVLGHLAFIPAFTGDSSRAMSLVDAGHQHCWYGVTPHIRSWLHCVAAETIARSGESDDHQRHIDLARDSLDNEAEAPGWFDYYDAARLDGFAGYADLTVGNFDGAAQKLQASLESLDRCATKQRTVLLADIATAHLDEPEHAASVLNDALDALGHDWYAIGHRRIGDVINRLPDSACRDEVHHRHREMTVTG